MKKLTSSTRFAGTVLCLALACLPATQPAAFAQEPGPAQPQQTTPAPTPPPQQDEPVEDILRVSTSLVQTDVSVVDKKGQFAGGLQREQFELKIDGRVQPVLFFERITAGSAGEAVRIAAARGETPGARGAATAVKYGRAVVFFVDDLHLTPEGVLRARELILNFIEREMMPGMQALVASASGQIGFLQQFTNDRAVLRAAVARIKPVSQASLDNERPEMSGYQAEMIDRGDRELFSYMVNQTLNENRQGYGDPGARMAAEITVRNRARRIRRQSAQLSGAAIASLESVVRARSPYGGRQTLFFISEGFTLDPQEADINRKIQRVTDIAARTGTVVYTIYTRGLAVGMIDASSGAGADLADIGSGSAFRGYSPSTELSATQEVLRGLAADTGGRAIINTNALDTAIANTLDETANYYLLAWRPEGVDAKAGAPRYRKIEISVKGRPDLSVRLRRNFLNASSAGEARAAATPAPAASTASTNNVLNSALNTLNTRRDLPVDAYAVFTNDAQAGSVINASVQVANDRLKFGPAAGGKSQAQVEVACAVLDERGKAVYSNGRTLTLDGNAASAPGASRGKLVTNFSIPVLAPGLYQFRTAARDAGSGLLGSAFEWVEVADLKADRLALSGLLVTERRRAAAPTAAATGAAAPNAGGRAPDILRVERRFARASHLMLQLYIYNAARKAGAAPDVELEIKILRDKKIVTGAPSHKVAVAPGGDPARIFYAAEVPLAGMTPGIYLLQVTATDRAGRTTAVRELDFLVE